MTNRDFYLQLVYASIISIVLLVLCYTLLPISDYVLLGVLGLVFFIVLSIFVFNMARKMTRARDLNAFTRLIMYNLMIKLFLSFAIIWVYYSIVKPQERLFILPYILIYLIFTIFEAMFLSKQARQ